MARKPKLVLFDEGINWLAPKYAAEKTGLTKPELARRADAGEIRFKADGHGTIEWYALPDIDHLRAANLSKILNKKPVKKRRKTPAQLEREWAAGPKLNETPVRLGPVAAHFEKVMLKDIESNRKKDGS